MPDKTSNRRRTLYYSGHVQGVGFRYTARTVASGYGVTGFVRNLPDGRVELVAEGPISELDGFLEDLAERMQRYIRHIQSVEGEASGGFDAFEVRMV